MAALSAAAPATTIMIMGRRGQRWRASSSRATLPSP
jgi:hypothetical protein